MSWRAGSIPPVMYWADCTTIWRAIWLRCSCRADGDVLNSASVEVHCCVFINTVSVWWDHFRSSVMCTPGNLKLLTLSTAALSMWMGAGSLCCLLKLTYSLQETALSSPLLKSILLQSTVCVLDIDNTRVQLRSWYCRFSLA